MLMAITSIANGYHIESMLMAITSNNLDVLDTFNGRKNVRLGINRNPEPDYCLVSFLSVCLSIYLFVCLCFFLNVHLRELSLIAVRYMTRGVHPPKANDAVSPILNFLPISEHLSESKKKFPKISDDLFSFSQLAYSKFITHTFSNSYIPPPPISGKLILLTSLHSSH